MEADCDSQAPTGRGRPWACRVLKCSRKAVGSAHTTSSIQPRPTLNKEGITPMPRVQDTDEVRILRYFEEGALEKAELLFHIIAEKMRRRMPPGGHQQRLSRSCTHGCIDRDDPFYCKTVRCISIQAGAAGQRRQDPSACDGPWLHQDLAPVETPAALLRYIVLKRGECSGTNTELGIGSPPCLARQTLP